MDMLQKGATGCAKFSQMPIPNHNKLHLPIPNPNIAPATQSLERTRPEPPAQTWTTKEATCGFNLGMQSCAHACRRN